MDSPVFSGVIHSNLFIFSLVCQLICFFFFLNFREWHYHLPIMQARNPRLILTLSFLHLSSPTHHHVASLFIPKYFSSPPAPLPPLWSNHIITLIPPIFLVYTSFKLLLLLLFFQRPIFNLGWKLPLSSCSS